MYTNKQYSTFFRVQFITTNLLLACSLPLYQPSLVKPSLLWIIALGFLILYCLSFLNRNPQLNHHFSICRLMLIHSMIFLMMMAHFSFRAEQFQLKQLSFSEAKNVFLIQAKIIDFPKHTVQQGLHSSHNIAMEMKVVKAVKNKDGSEVLSKGSIIRLSCYRCHKNYQIGGIWLLNARLKPPKGSASWGAFDYEKYAFANELSAIGHFNELSATLLKTELSIIQKLRLNIRQILTRYAGSKKIAKNNNNVALLYALIVGDRSLLLSEHWRLFRETGTSHLIAISGLHITLLFFLGSFFIRKALELVLTVLPTSLSRYLMDNVFRYLSFQSIAMFSGLIIAILYALSAGFSVPTQRAILMLSVICTSQMIGHKLSLFESLCLAIIILLVCLPLSTLHSGFWLSCLALLIIVMLLKSRESKWLMQFRMALVMMPITLLIFNQTSIVSPIANIIFIPVIGFIVLPISLLLVVVALLIPDSSYWLILCWKAFDFILDGVWQGLEYFSVVQYSILNQLPSVHMSWINITLLILLAILILFWRFAFARFLLMMPILMMTLIDSKPELEEGEFSITALDVGQALALIIETQNAYTIYDTGNAFMHSDSAERIIIPYLKQAKAKKIHTIIVSHLDKDHVGGLASMIKFSDQTAILVNRPAELKKITALALTSRNEMKSHFNFAHSSYKNDIKNTQKCYSKLWQQDGVSFEILPAFKSNHAVLNKRNNTSCILIIKSSYGSAILPGDIERAAEHYLVENHQEKIDVDLLVAAHHGSRTSSTPLFLKHVEPKHVIISAAYFNPYGHPHPGVLKRIKKYSNKIMTTADSGSIKIIYLKDGIQTQEYRALHPRFWYSDSLN